MGSCPAFIVFVDSIVALKVHRWSEFVVESSHEILLVHYQWIVLNRAHVLGSTYGDSGYGASGHGLKLQQTSHSERASPTPCKESGDRCELDL